MSSLVQVRAHPAVAAFRAHRQRVRDLAVWLQGAREADDRGNLSPEERARLARESAAWPETRAAYFAHRQRLVDEYPHAWEAWITAELAAARAAVAADDSPYHRVQVERWEELLRGPDDG